MFRLEKGEIEVIDTFGYDTVDSELDTYYCCECGENLTEKEIKEGIKKTLSA